MNFFRKKEVIEVVNPLKGLSIVEMQRKYGVLEEPFSEGVLACMDNIDSKNIDYLSDLPPAIKKIIDDADKVYANSYIGRLRHAEQAG